MRFETTLGHKSEWESFTLPSLMLVMLEMTHRTYSCCGWVNGGRGEKRKIHKILCWMLMIETQQLDSDAIEAKRCEWGKPGERARRRRRLENLNDFTYTLEEKEAWWWVNERCTRGDIQHTPGPVMIWNFLVTVLNRAALSRDCHRFCRWSNRELYSLVPWKKRV